MYIKWKRGVFMINLFHSRYYARKCAEDMGLSKYVVAEKSGIKRNVYRIYIPQEELRAPSRYRALTLAKSNGICDSFIKREERGDEVFYQVYSPFLCADVMEGNDHD